MRNRTLLLTAALLAACGSSSDPPDPSALTAPLANVTIDQITLLQGLEAPIMQGGNPADHSNIPLVAQRDSVLRLWVTPGSGFTPHPLTARVRIVTTGPLGATAQVFSVTAPVSRPTMENDLTTSLNIPIPGVALELGSSITVVVNDTKGDPADSTTSYAKWPQDGSLADLGVIEEGPHVRVMIVPVQYMADGSGRLPDTSDAQIMLYQQRFYQLYPSAQVEVTVHAPWPSNIPINAGGGGMFNLLMALGGLRSADMADPDLYYYAAFEPTADFGSYCGGGCVTGESMEGVPISSGIGYSGPGSTDTAAHEVGHAHGLNHTPGCGAAGPYVNDMNMPYPNMMGLDTVWGYDPFAPVATAMIDPNASNDIMSYCGMVKWISDFHYSQLFRRIKKDNAFYYDWRSGAGRAPERYRTVAVLDSGETRVSSVVTEEPWVLGGEPREVALGGGTATGYFFPLAHQAGGMLYVPERIVR